MKKRNNYIYIIKKDFKVSDRLWTACLPRDCYITPLPAEVRSQHPATMETSRQQPCGAQRLGHAEAADTLLSLRTADIGFVGNVVPTLHVPGQGV